MAEELEVFEGEVVDVELVPARHGTLFGTDDPSQVIERAAGVANGLAEVVRKQGLVSVIQGKEYPRVEAWTLLGSMLGVFPVVAWSREVGEGQGWEARVEARTRDGSLVGAAEAECLRSEKTWARRDSYALRSMAQTRATSKALRGPLGFVMTIAGFEATPESEMPADLPSPKPQEAAGDVAVSWPEWLDRMAQLGVREPQTWLAQAVESRHQVDSLKALKSGERSAMLADANEVYLLLVEQDGSRSAAEAALNQLDDDRVRAVFARVFEGAVLEGPADLPADLPDGDEIEFAPQLPVVE